MKVFPVPVPPIKNNYSGLLGASFFDTNTYFNIVFCCLFNYLFNLKYSSLLRRNGCAIHESEELRVSCVDFGVL